MLMAPKIVDLEDTAFNPFAQDEAIFGGVDDPYPTFARLRRECPVQKRDFREIFTGVREAAFLPEPSYSVFGYDEAVEVFTRPDLYSNHAFSRTMGDSLGRSIVMMDPPDHTRYRRIFQKAFLPNIVAKWKTDIIDPIVIGLIEHFRHRGRADLVGEFTIRYPFQVIYKQLDLPAGDDEIFHKLAVTQVLGPVYPELAREAGRKLGDYFEQLLDARGDSGEMDLVSLFATVEADGERLPRDTAIAFLRQLINAAGDTTYRATGTLLMALLKDTDQLEAIRKDQSLIPAAIEEALRWDGPVTSTWRTAARDTVLAGVDIPAGTTINVVNGAANRDETKFDDPDRFDIFRSSNTRHVAFATGVHVCIGQHLAKLEMTRALTILLERLPNLRLDPDYPAPVSRGFQLRSPSELRVVFDT